jgi:hypothetical protein
MRCFCRFFVLFWGVLLCTPLFGEYFFNEDIQPFAIYFKDDTGKLWIVKERLAETLLIGVPVEEKAVKEQEAASAFFREETLHLVQFIPETSKIRWCKTIAPMISSRATRNALSLNCGKQGSVTESYFLLRDGQHWDIQEKIHAKYLTKWEDYQDGVLLPGARTGKPLAYILSAKGLTPFEGAASLHPPIPQKNGILTTFSYDGTTHFLDIQTNTSYPLPKQYQFLSVIDLNNIFIQELNGKHRYGVYDAKNTETHFFSPDTLLFGVNTFYFLKVKSKSLQVYNSRGKCFHWEHSPMIEAYLHPQICPPHEIIISETSSETMVWNTTTSQSLSIDSFPLAFTQNLFREALTPTGEKGVLDLITGDSIPRLHLQNETTSSEP